jgi:release factor glutamine methyltransferase
MTTISKAVATAPIPRLDAEVLLAHLLQVSRAYLHAWSDRELTLAEYEAFFALVQQSIDGQPTAYLTGHREFWSLNLLITPAALIPRPETELLVELALKVLPNQDSLSIVDLGTGSGAIALSLAKERPNWIIYATDNFPDVIALAIENARRLRLTNIFFHQGFWCQALPEQQFHAIISNPPYIAKDDPHCNHSVAKFEPHSALFAEDNGLADIHCIIQQARHYLVADGYLLIEHGFQQAADVRGLFIAAGYNNVDSYQDLSGLDRVTMAQYPGLEVAS